MATFKIMDTMEQYLRVRSAEFWLYKKECNMSLLLNFSIECSLSLVSQAWLSGGTIHSGKGTQVTKVKAPNPCLFTLLPNVGHYRTL